MTKGIPISKTLLTTIEDHQEKWKSMCNRYAIGKLSKYFQVIYSEQIVIEQKTIKYNNNRPLK